MTSEPEGSTFFPFELPSTLPEVLSRRDFSKKWLNLEKVTNKIKVKKSVLMAEICASEETNGHVPTLREVVEVIERDLQNGSENFKEYQAHRNYDPFLRDQSSASPEELLTDQHKNFKGVYQNERPFYCLPTIQLPSREVLEAAGGKTYTITHDKKKQPSAPPKYTLQYTPRKDLILPEGQQYICDICNSDERSPFQLCEHIAIYHTPPDKRLWKCIYCNTKFGRRGGLRRHVQMVHMHMTHLCPVKNCTHPGYKCTKALNAHIKTHNRPYACNKCDEVFGTSSDLAVHSVMH